MSVACVACAHHRRIPMGIAVYPHRCVSPQNIDIVTGRPHNYPCDLVRKNSFLCGPDARWFEARPPRRPWWRIFSPAPTKSLAIRKIEG